MRPQSGTLTTNGHCYTCRRTTKWVLKPGPGGWKCANCTRNPIDQPKSVRVRR